MCPPDYFDVTYEINAWMSVANGPDTRLARQQWSALHRILTQDMGADVTLLAPQPGLPDMVFTANAGITQGNVFVPARFRYAERQGEQAHFIHWFEEKGWEIAPLPADAPGAFEGEGDALLYGETLLVGYGQRSDLSVYPALGHMLGRTVLPLRLTDTRWYHLDTCLIALRPDLLAYYPPAFDAPSVDALEKLPGEKLLLNDNDALRFGGNAVVMGNHIAMNAGCNTLAEALEARGFTVHATDLSEFLKSGGSAKCLVLMLDH